VTALAEIATDAALDAEGWGAVKKRVGAETGRKGKELFRPLRVAITGEVSGLELDRLVPLIASGQRLFPDRIATVAERARKTGAWVP
jgi:glutamyl-tRNA synthetase